MILFLIAISLSISTMHDNLAQAVREYTNSPNLPESTTLLP